MKNKFKLAGLLVVFATVSLAFASCSVDSEDIIGTWGCTHSLFEREDYNDPTRDKTIEDEEYGKVITFNSDGTFSGSGFYYIHLLEITEGGIWMIDGNKLIINRRIWTIKKLNKTTLSIVGEAYYSSEHGVTSETEDIENADGICRYELQFKRQ